MSPLPTRLPPRSHACRLTCATLWLLALLPLSAFGAPAVALAGEPLFEWRPFLAPFHAVVLHFPIGFVTMTAVLEVYRIFYPSEELKPVTALTLWLSLLSGLLTAAFGVLRAADGGYETNAVEAHRWTGIAVVVATLATLGVQHLAYRHEATKASCVAYRGLLALTLGVLVTAGHMGGNLTHGSKYLTENAPAFVRELIEEKTPTTIVLANNTTASPESRFYVEEVLPILEKKCVRCHGPEKQKGEYRLDQPEVALKGGESGKEAIKPGDPMASEFVRLILLPSDHDEVMPPEGKEPLTADEVLTLIRWIQKGAPFPLAAAPSAVP